MDLLNDLYNNSLYGNYRTRKFTDIFSSVDEFLAEYKSNETYNMQNISDTAAVALYYLLYAKYGNSAIANSDENQFKYKLWSIIFMYGPTWEKRLDIQKKLRQLTDDELFNGTMQIYNHSYNPSDAPATGEELLKTINDQNTSSTKRGKLEAYNILLDLLKTDVSEPFLEKFKKLFIVIVEPQIPLWYKEV